MLIRKQKYKQKNNNHFLGPSMMLLSGLLLCSRAFGINRSSCPLTRNGQGCGLPTQFTALYLPPTCNCRAAVLERSPRLLPPTCKPSTSLQLCLKFSPKVRKPTQLGAPAALNSDTRRIRDAGQMPSSPFLGRDESETVYPEGPQVINNLSLLDFALSLSLLIHPCFLHPNKLPTP